MSWSWPESLPSPVLDGDAATYPEIMAGVDLRLVATESGFVTHVVVKTPEAAASPELDAIRFDMATEGLAVAVTGEGGLEATDDASGGVVFAAPPASMWSAPEGSPLADEPVASAATNEATSSSDVELATDQGPGEPAAVAPVEVSVPTTGDAVTLVPDQEMLDDPDTSFPVVIDPFWDTVNRSAWTSPNRSWPSKSYWKFDGKSEQGVGTCAGWSNCGDGSTYRLFYQFDISKFKGKSIGNAVVSVLNTHSAQCTEHPVDLWHTGKITSSTTWSNQPAFKKRAASRSFAYGGNQDPCRSQAKGEFPIKALVQEGADKGWNRVTVALRVNESDKYHWKKFSRDASLRVTANESPSAVSRSALSLRYGGACADTTATEPAVIRSAQGNIFRVASGAVRDPDPEGQVRVHFLLQRYDGTQVWQGWSDWKAEGSYFAIGMPTVPQNVALRWMVRVQDRQLDGFGVASSSPWSSPSCTFKVDTSVPAAPVITSRNNEYPQPDPSDPNYLPHGGAGNYGYFDISSSSSDAARFEVWFNNTRSTVIAKAGNPVSVRYLPLDAGEHVITAAVFDGAGNKSVSEYVFHVAEGADPVGNWTFDDPVEGEPAPTGYSLSGNATIASGLVDPSERAALSLDGAGDYAVAPSGAGRVDTTKHFSVEAWVRPDALSDLDRMSFVVAQPGKVQQAFRLYWGGAWSFASNHEDTPSSGVTLVRHEAPERLGRWTHLLGVYDDIAHTMTIYVDGVRGPQIAYDAGWNGTGNLHIGAGQYNSGTPNYFFDGLIDGVRTYDRVVTSAEAAEKAKIPPAVVSRWNFEDTTYDPTSGFANSLADGPSLVGSGTGVARDPFAFQVDEGAMTLSDGGYATAGAVPVNTADSFTATGWFQGVAETGAPMTALSVNGTRESSVAVRFIPGAITGEETDGGMWEVELRSADSGPQTWRIPPSDKAPEVTAWHHVAVVYDAARSRATLYLDGQEAGSASNVMPWAARQTVTVGRGLYSQVWREPWHGAVDDVWLLRGALSQTQVRYLQAGLLDLPTEVPADVR